MNQSIINFMTMHIILRMTTMLSQLVHKVRRCRLFLCLKERPFAEGSMDYSCARAFYSNKNRDIQNIILREVYVYVNECY